MKNQKYIMINYFKNNDLSLNKIFSILFNKRVLRIKYLNEYKLKCMPEYKFYLLKFNVVLEDFSNYTVFIKLVDKAKVEENLFCFWLFCEEYYNVNLNLNKYKANILNYKVKHYEKRYKLKLFKNNKKTTKNLYVDIIDLEKYKKEKNKKRIRYDIKKKLFVGVI